MATSDEPRRRGLRAVEQAREARSKLRWPPAKFWAWSGLVLSAALIFHWKRTQGEVESARQKLMAQQRAVAVELGAKWGSLRDRVERWTLELAKSAEPEVVDREALAAWDFRDKPGIYLRMRVDQATSPEAVRAGARESLKDAFTACLLRVPNPNPYAGKECKRTRDCPTGEFCNEADRCSRAMQPYNLRVAYRTMHVLSDEWVREVQEADDELRLRVFEGAFQDTMRDDIPLAIDLLTKAQYFLLVLDEGRSGGADAGAEGSSTAARVAVWRLADDKLVFRARRDAGGHLVGGMPAVDRAVLEARERQANSCALALAVRQAMGDTNAAAVAP